MPTYTSSVCTFSPKYSRQCESPHWEKSQNPLLCHHWATSIPGAGNPHLPVPQNALTQHKNKEKNNYLLPTWSKRYLYQWSSVTSVYLSAFPTLRRIFWELWRVRGLIKQKEEINMISRHSQNQRHKYVTKPSGFSKCYKKGICKVQKKQKILR